MRILVLIFIGIFFSSCGKEFLEAKPDKALVVPKTLVDYQALLDDMNQQINQTPGLIEFATDDFVATDEAVRSVSNRMVENIYLWKKDIYESDNIPDWDMMYLQVLRTNVVLEGLNEMEREVRNQKQYDEIKGTALFFRAWHFFALLQSFSMPYDPNTSEKELGIILKLKADINEKPARSNIEECYTQILIDLEEAVSLLPRQTLFPSRPSLAAGFAFLSRVHLSKFDYDNAEQYADLSLRENNELLNFNSLGFSFPNPFLERNKEVILYSLPILYASSFLRNANIDEAFYRTFHLNDLRKKMYFKEGDKLININSSFEGTGLYPFTGLATSEMYLVKAECLARKGDYLQSLEVLNSLLRTRWDENEVYIPISASRAEEALQMVLQERRKELFFRGLRWYDLRRLNRDSRFAKTLERTYEGELYVLEPESRRYALPIPRAEMRLNPNIIPNER